MFIAFIPLTTAADISLAELQIEFWPEYDRPAMLIIYRGTIRETESLPSRIVMSIPEQFGPPIAVAYANELNNLMDLAYDSTAIEGTLEIVFDTPTRVFQFEYYDSSIDITSPLRRYSFSDTARFAIESLVVVVQTPIDAEIVSISPAMDREETGPDGIKYSLREQRNLSTEDQILLDLQYRKSSTLLTIDRLRTEDIPQQPMLTEKSPSRGGAVGLILLALAALVAIVIMSTIGAAKGRSRNISTTGNQSKATNGPDKQVEDANQRRKHVVCSQCGETVEQGDKYCRICGNALA